MNSMSDRSFVDTNILIYAHDRTAGRKHEISRDLIDRLWESGTGCLSVQILQEFYVIATKKLRDIEPQEARGLVETYSRWHLHRPGEGDVLNAVDLHQSHQLSFWDAMVVISARKLNCQLLQSEDLNDRQNIMGVMITNPFTQH